MDKGVLQDNQLQSNDKFSEEAIKRFARIRHTYQNIRNRLLSEGYIINGDTIIPPNHQKCYNNNDNLA